MVVISGVTKEGQRGAVAPGRSRRRVQNSLSKNIFNDRKSEFDEVCRMSQQ